MTKPVFRPRRVDAMQAAIGRDLVKAGRNYHDTHMVGGGFVDAIVGTPTRRIVGLEFKEPGEPLTPAEVKFHAKWNDYPIHVVHNLEEALEVTT